MSYSIERCVRYRIWREPEPEGAVLERRSFVGECDCPIEAAAEVERLEKVAQFVETFNAS